MKNLMFSRIVFLVVFVWAVGIIPVFAAGVFSAITVDKELLKGANPIDLTIFGPPLATKEQCIKYLLRQNPLPLITVTPKELVDYYYTEGTLEGIRPDVAFAQALHETGNFRYGGDVIPLQNNYCGLGTTGGGVKGGWFPSTEIGVRAQIQHLLAYASTRPPLMPVVDPRYELLKRSSNFGQAVTWTDLNGKWAVPGRYYGQMILKIHANILAES